VRHVHLLDTSISSGNRGDDIIVDFARRHLMSAVGDSFLSTSSSHDGLGRYSRKLAARADVAFLLGSNALAADYRGRKFHWRVTWRDIPALAEKVVLLGVGAHKDFDRVNPRQISFLRKVLSPRHIHSVRDAQAGQILERCGLEFINTSCPTLWGYATVQPEMRRNPKVACFTLTAGKPQPSDRYLIQTLSECYERVLFWPQQEPDLAYMEQIRGAARIEVIAGNLAAYDATLASERPDYVGTRLHGGIRAMSYGCRTLVLSIDNRASALGAEAGVPVLARTRLEADLVERISSNTPARITVDAAGVARFLEQFRGA